MTTHKIKKGFDLPLAGRAEQVLADAPEPTVVGLEIAEFAGIKPKVLVKKGDQVQTGQPIFLNKLDRDVVWCSPVTGTVKAVEFGERRFLRRVLIENGGSEALACPSLTLMTMFEYVPSCAAAGVPERVPVVLSKNAPNAT